MPSSINPSVFRHPRWRASSVAHLKLGMQIVPMASVVRIDAAGLERLEMVVHLIDGTTVPVQGIEALELAMLLKPSLVEGHRLRFPKFMWFVHNMMGHPLMQILALMGCYKAAFWVHDVTVPRPLGARRPTSLP